MHWKETLPEWYVSKYGYQPCVNVGTAGHVDHGKTTLIQSLTGEWTSVHSQELKRGITIRVGYSDAAFYKCPSCEAPAGYSAAPKCPTCGGASELSRVVSFVDSPGHESLMANMLSGAALMDGALLVVGANHKVPQMQTEEHLLALQILGIRQIVVVQNKVDLLSYERALESYDEIAKFLGDAGDGDGGGGGMAKSPVVPVSAQAGLNTDALVRTIEESIPTPERDGSADPVMHVLRSFDVNKPSTPIPDIKGGVVGGSLVRGSFKAGDEVEIRPGILNERRKEYEPVSTEIVSLGTGAGIVDEVRPGGLVALGTKLDPSMTGGDSFIGSVVGRPGTLPENSDRARLQVSLFDSAVGASGGEAARVTPLAEGEALRMSVGTAPALCAVSSVRDGGAIADVKFRRPMCLFEGGSVAISRRISDRWRLIGAGTVLG